jgi:pleckstrin homology domain-containing family H
MEPQGLAHELATAVDGLHLFPLTKSQSSPTSDVDMTHDYAEIYTPSCEKAPIWLKGLPSGTSSTTTSESATELPTPRPPTPPLHRFPSWEAKIYQVANDGLAGDEESQGDQESTGMGSSLGGGGGTLRSQTVSAGYCDISVPVYATVKGRASQIRSMPFTGESSDDSSDGEDHAVMLPVTSNNTNTHNSHNSSSTDNTETSTSGSASSPSKSVKTTSSLSPAKRSGSESPKPKVRGKCCRLAALHFNAILVAAVKSFISFVFFHYFLFTLCYFLSRQV